MTADSADDLYVRTRIEQIKLIYDLVGLTVVPAISVAVILFFALRKPDMEIALSFWLAGVVACKLFQMFDAGRQRTKVFEHSGLNYEVARLMLIHGLDALAWTLLSWISLNSATPTQAILIVAVLTGIVGGAVPLMSPVLPVFVTYALVDLSVLVPRFLTMHDRSFAALALCALPYLLAMTLLARNSSIATMQSIRLRFENLELTRNLRIEAEKSKTAYSEVLEANIAKSRFIAAASHDLRQPIHALGLFLEVLNLRNPRSDQKQAIDDARSAAKATSEMLDTLLDFSRLEAGVVKPRIKAFAVQDIFGGIETELAPRADEKHLSYRTRDTELVGYSDPAIVELILRNLISNAIRYTNDGGVLVACRKRNHDLAIEVWDTGIGIDQKDHSDIFKEFYQVGNPERDRRKGLGLGLSIAGRLAESINASLTMNSVLGRGSMFRLIIPKVDSTPPAEDGANVVEVVVNSGSQVLVVDDDESVRRGMSILLEQWGLVCTAVGSVEEAKSYCASKKPDLIISDLRLRDPVNGIAAIKQIRDNISEEVPALIITGETAPGPLLEAQASGLPVLHKPVSGERLALAIAHAMKSGDLPDRPKASTCQV
ncbi:ATP-binding response regulator [Mesorhizobium loti]|uniref:histidine kinase n=1 Tax=Mesorhizobium loti R88b TaxID=935548 RepID=A0A6M7WXR6_RHILI|nr:hybrid sensor histidine kinase/response regulator [Mesorhizobium loti]QKD03821.1 hybrid sensor histidine kinase/response regulator [Mesorhizobium loti R88b]